MYIQHKVQVGMKNQSAHPHNLISLIFPPEETNPWLPIAHQGFLIRLRSESLMGAQCMLVAQFTGHRPTFDGIAASFVVGFFVITFASDKLYSKCICLLNTYVQTLQ